MQRVAPRYFASKTIDQMLAKNLNSASRSFGKVTPGKAVKVLLVFGCNYDQRAEKVETAIREVAGGHSLGVEVENSYAPTFQGVVEDIRRIQPQIIFLPRSLDSGTGMDVARWIDNYWQLPIKGVSYSRYTVESQRDEFTGCRCVTLFVDAYQQEYPMDGVREVFKSLGLFEPVRV